MRDGLSLGGATQQRPRAPAVLALPHRVLLLKQLVPLLLLLPSGGHPETLRLGFFLLSVVLQQMTHLCVCVCV
jgi:hypothetical protein